MNYLSLLIGAYLAIVNSRLGDVRYDLKEWDSFKTQHNKSYDSREVELMRRSIFAYNKHRIDQFNVKESEEAGFELGVNNLTDLSEIEIKIRNGFKLPEESDGLRNDAHAETFLENIFNDDSDIPDEVDWRKVPGRVSRVKNQG